METDLAERCDPALLSCITADEILSVLPFIFVVFGAILVWRFIRAELKKTSVPHRHHQRTRGTEPGEGETVHIVGLNASRGSHRNIIVRHTKDPQKHAQAMMPAKARKKD